MSTELRASFRAPIVDVLTATLCFGIERVPVKLLEESIGGYYLLAQRRPPFALDSVAELKHPDGHCVAGRIKHIAEVADGFRIDFQRSELINESFDLGEAFPVTLEKGIPVRVYAIVLIVGLGVGWLCASGIAFKWITQASGWMS